MTRFGLLAGLVICWPALSIVADRPAEKDTAAQLRSLDGNVYPRDDENAKERSRMLSRDVRSRLQAAKSRPVGVLPIGMSVCGVMSIQPGNDRPKVARVAKNFHQVREGLLFPLPKRTELVSEKTHNGQKTI